MSQKNHPSHNLNDQDLLVKFYASRQQPSVKIISNPPNHIQAFFKPQMRNLTKVTCLSKFLIIFFILSYSITIISCACDQSAVDEVMYVSQISSCKIRFDACQSYEVSKCSKDVCKQDQSQCVKTMSTSYSNTCRQYCCSKSQDQKNANNPNALKLCQNNTSKVSGTSLDTGGYILIATFVGLFFVILIASCCCKARRSQAQNNIAVAITPVYPLTAVNLASYNMDDEGPYFVNSNDNCAICLDNNVNLRTHCNHFYHAACLSEWLKKKVNNPCPLCMGTTYNPVKLYCKECHAGDRLVNVQAQISSTVIKQYDLHKCENCKKFGNQTFTLSEQKSENASQDKKSLGKNKMKYHLNEEGEEKMDYISQNHGAKSKRRNRKVQSLKRVNLGSKQNFDEDNLDKSQKKFHPNHNNTDLGP